MPFSSYSTFGKYDFVDEPTSSYSVSYSSYGSRGYTIDFGQGNSQAESSSGTQYVIFQFEQGSTNGRQTNGTTDHNENGYTLDEPYIPFYTEIAGSEGITTSTVSVFSTSFIENQGFNVTNNTEEETFLFSDYPDDSAAVNILSHDQTSAEVELRQTSSTELTFVPPVGESTTYSEVTSYLTNSSRDYTAVVTVTDYGVGIDFADAQCNRVFDVGYVIFPQAGANWTVDGSSLMYLRLFETTGTYGEYYTSIFKDNETQTFTISAFESFFVPNATAQGDQVVTLFSDVIGTITYDVIGQTSESFSIGNSYYFDANNQFVLDTDIGTSSFWYKPTKTTSGLSYTNQFGSTIGPYGNSDTDSWIIGGVVSSTRLINVDTTISSFLYSFANTKSTYLTYRALAKTLSTLSYILHDYDTDTWGSSSFSSSSETAYTIIQTQFNDTEQASENGFTSETLTIIYPPINAYKNLYTLQYYSSINPTFFTQQSPNFNWVVADSANLSVATKYYNSLSPSSALTKLYFTTYKYHRYGIVNAPIFAVPIDFTDENGYPSFTYQAVSVPSKFYFGEDPASVTQTYSVENGTTFTTSSFTIGYAGTGSFLKMNDVELNDMSGNGDPSYYYNIFHTIAVEQSASSCASWSMDNYYYWIGGSNRVISGTASNPISIVGNYQPFTMIASSWGSGLPFVTIDVTHQNSYSYNY
jgi:hypothetical protein